MSPEPLPPQRDDGGPPPTERPERLALPTAFPLSPLVRLTLLVLYVALTLPLPFLATATSAPVPGGWLWGALVVGAIAIAALLSERVELDESEIRVTYPTWVRWLRPGWRLPWEQIRALKPRTTGQGGLVYYFLDDRGQGFLLPMRVAGFGRLVDIVAAKTGIDTRDVKPLAQPWMYLLLLLFSLLLLAVDGWAIATALSLQGAIA